MFVLVGIWAMQEVRHGFLGRFCLKKNMCDQIHVIYLVFIMQSIDGPIINFLFPGHLTVSSPVSNYTWTVSLNWFANHFTKCLSMYTANRFCSWLLLFPVIWDGLDCQLFVNNNLTSLFMP